MMEQKEFLPKAERLATLSVPSRIRMYVPYLHIEYKDVVKSFGLNFMAARKIQ